MNAQDKRDRLVDALVNMDETSVLSQVEERLANGDDPLQILEDANEGLRIVGTRYEEGHFYVAALMFGGEIFREVVDIVQPMLIQRLSGKETGKILVGTVKGDIHDIGKNVFITMLRAHGFTVTDLGVDVPPDRFFEAAAQIQPDIIGLHGLLTTSYEMMKATIRLIHSASDPDVAGTAIIIGGGTVNGMVCSYVSADYWATDAKVGVDLCKQIMTRRIEIGSASGA